MQLVTFCTLASLLCASAVASSSSASDGTVAFHESILQRAEKLLLHHLQCPDMSPPEDKIKETLTNLVDRVTELSVETDNLKVSFIQDAMGARPESLEEALEGWREPWLPEIPSASLSTFNALEEKSAEMLLRNFTIYTVALQQVHRDIALHEPAFKHRFKRIDNRSRMIFCQAQAIAGVRLDNKFVRKLITHHSYNRSSTRSARNHHIYLILRDFSRYLRFAVQFMLFTLSDLQASY